MKRYYALLCIAAAAVFMGGLFRPGCRVIVEGRVLPGIYEPAAAYGSAALAQRTAEEITRTHEAPPFQLVPVLCLQRESDDHRLLYHVLLEAYEGVEKLYAVHVEGRQVGLLEELWQVSALLREYPNAALEITTAYSHPQAADSLMHVRTVLRELEGGSVGPF